MAAVEITISGVLIDKYGRTVRPCTIVGEATLTGLGVGGGPVIPPEQGSPPGFWGGGNVPMPTPPIANVPGAPGYSPGGPVHIWGPPDPRPTPPIYMPGPHPEHPIVIPPCPTEPPVNASDPKPPPSDGGWGWHPEYGWGYFPGPGEAEPKGRR